MVYKCFDKNSRGSVVDTEPNYQLTSQMNFTSRSLENLRKERFIHLLETIFGMFI